MANSKVPGRPARVDCIASSQRNVGMIFSTMGFLLWVAIWGQMIQGTRAASVLDVSFPVVLTAVSLAFTIWGRRAD